MLKIVGLLLIFVLLCNCGCTNNGSREELTGSQESMISQETQTATEPQTEPEAPEGIVIIEKESLDFDPFAAEQLLKITKVESETPKYAPIQTVEQAKQLGNVILQLQLYPTQGMELALIIHYKKENYWFYEYGYPIGSLGDVNKYLIDGNTGEILMAWDE